MCAQNYVRHEQPYSKQHKPKTMLDMRTTLFNNTSHYFAVGTNFSTAKNRNNTSINRATSQFI